MLVDESPGTVTAISKGDVDVSTALASDRVASLVKNLASKVLLLDSGIESELEHVDILAASKLGLANETALNECNVTRELAHTGDADVDGRLRYGCRRRLRSGRRRSGIALLESRVADDGNDVLGAGFEGPVSTIGISKCNFAASVAQNDDGLIKFIAHLAAEVFLLHVCAEGEKDGVVGAGGADGALGLAPALIERSLGCELTRTGELDDDGVIGG